MMPLLLLAAAVGTVDAAPVMQRLIDRCPNGGTVTFPRGVFSVSTLQMKPHCSYRGAAEGTTFVLRTRNGFLADLSERVDIRLSGIAFDGNHLGGALLMQGYAPVRGIRVENCSFRNVTAASTYPANITIFSSWGIIDSSLIGNTFTNVSGGIAITTVQNVEISNNTFTNVTQSDAIFVAPNPVSFPSGDNLRIVNNTGSGLAKMGIEIFRPDPPNGSRLLAPLVESNRFSRFTARDGEGMGLSITHGENAIVRNNVIDNSGGVHQENGIGIEIIVRGAQVTGNTVTRGFGYGIVVQGTRETHIVANKITGVGKDGILFACDSGRNRCDSTGSQIENNSIVNARMNGIHFQNRWAGSQVVNNVIRRGSDLWKDTAGFEAIRESTPRGNSVLRGNVISTKTSGGDE